jgi:hypothetical protein
VTACLQPAAGKEGRAGGLEGGGERGRAGAGYVRVHSMDEEDEGYSGWKVADSAARAV